MLMILNAHHDMVAFTFPECAGGSKWKLLIDTNIADLEGGKIFATGDAYDVTARSLLLFAFQRDEE
jgi:isoamylase